MYPPQLVPQQPMLRPSRHPHNQALGGHQPSPLLHPRKLCSPCATEISVLQLPQHCQHRGVHTAASFIYWGPRYRQSGFPAQTGSQKVTQGQVGIQTYKAPWHQPDPFLWHAQPGCCTKSTTQKGKFRTVQAGFHERQPKTHFRLLGFHLGLKLTVPDSSTQTAPCSVPAFHTRHQR